MDARTEAQYTAKLLRRIASINRMELKDVNITGLHKAHHCLSVQFTAKRGNSSYVCNVGLTSRDEINLVNNFKDMDLDYKLRLQI